MNEKYLWELWDKTTHPHPIHGGKDMNWPIEFAELIIKECTKVADESQFRYRQYPVSIAIEKHFGIE